MTMTRTPDSSLFATVEVCLGGSEGRDRTRLRQRWR
jgi:hypothetical protein